MDLSQLSGNTLLIVSANDLKDFADYLERKHTKPDPIPQQETEQPISQPEAIKYLTQVAS